MNCVVILSFLQIFYTIGFLQYDYQSLEKIHHSIGEITAIISGLHTKSVYVAINGGILAIKEDNLPAEVLIGNLTADFSNGNFTNSRMSRSYGMVLVEEILFFTDYEYGCVRTLNLLSGWTTTFIGVCGELGAQDGLKHMMRMMKVFGLGYSYPFWLVSEPAENRIRAYSTLTDASTSMAIWNPTMILSLSRNVLILSERTLITYSNQLIEIMVQSRYDGQIVSVCEDVGNLYLVLTDGTLRVLDQDTAIETAAYSLPALCALKEITISVKFKYSFIGVGGDIYRVKLFTDYTSLTPGHSTWFEFKNDLGICTHQNIIARFLLVDFSYCAFKCAALTECSAFVHNAKATCYLHSALLHICYVESFRPCYGRVFV